MIDKDAGELIADGFVDQHGGHGGVDPAGQSADHPCVADLGADLGDFGVAEMGHGPLARTSGDAMGEIAQQRGSDWACAPLPDGTARRRSAAPSSAMAANGAFSDTAITLKPSGRLITRSPWLIHTFRGRRAR